MTDRNICAGDAVSFWAKRGDRDVYLTATALTMTDGWIVAQFDDGQRVKLKRSNITPVVRGAR